MDNILQKRLDIGRKGHHLMVKRKYRITREEFIELRKQASREYYEFHILQKHKSKALTPMAKKVRNIRLRRLASTKECTNEHIKKAYRISVLRYKIKMFRSDATLRRADWLIEDYHDIIAEMHHSSVIDFISRVTRFTISSEESGYIIDLNGWHLSASYYSDLSDDGCGKWMCFFLGDNYPWASSIVEMAVQQGICCMAKCSLPTHLNDRGRGVICLYGEYSDYEFHERCTQFMIDHNMIQRTKKGLFHDISFKMDWMTLLEIYGISGPIHLSDIRNLETGEWIYKEENEK